MLSCDTEFFQNPRAALSTLDELVPLGKDITFSTKMILGSKILSRLSKIQEKLMNQGRILSVSVSIPMIDKSGEVEIGVPTPVRRMAFLKTLKESGLFPYVGIRPILPPSLVTNEEIGRIVDGTVENAFGYIIGPYWFKEDKFRLLDNRSLPIFQRKVQWLDDDSSWYIYEDKERERQIAEIISQRGGVLYERSSEAVVAIRNRHFAK
jgi:DNA repair photolyase